MENPNSKELLVDNGNADINSINDQESKYLGANIYLKEMPVEEVKVEEIKTNIIKEIGYYDKWWKKVLDLILGFIGGVVVVGTNVFNLINNPINKVLVIVVLMVILYKIERKYIAIGLLILMVLSLPTLLSIVIH